MVDLLNESCHFSGSNINNLVLQFIMVDIMLKMICNNYITSNFDIMILESYSLEIFFEILTVQSASLMFHCCAAFDMVQLQIFMVVMF